MPLSCSPNHVYGRGMDCCPSFPVRRSGLIGDIKVPFGWRESRSMQVSEMAALTACYHEPLQGDRGSDIEEYISTL